MRILKESVGVPLLALAALLLLVAAVPWLKTSLAATAGQPGATDIRSEASARAAAESPRAVEGKEKGLPGHGGFCTEEDKAVSRSMVSGRGQAAAKTAPRGHGGYLSPGEKC